MKSAFLFLSLTLAFSNLSLAKVDNSKGHSEQHSEKKAEKHSEKHSEKHAKGAMAKPASRFKVDEPLKVRMETILNTMKSMHHEKKMTKEKYAEIGGKLELTVQDIFKTCKLSPEADTAAHPILADILAGAQEFKKGEDGHEKIHHALLRYEEYFDHPGWDHSKDE